MTAGPLSMLGQHLPLSYDWRGRGRSLSLAEERAAVLRTASNRQRQRHCRQ